MNSFDHVPLGTSSPVESLRGEIDRLTVLRDISLDPPLVALIGLMEELLAEDWQAYNVCWSYHEFLSAVLHADAPRVLGDPWRDYLLYAALERDHLFARRASSGRVDQTLLSAFESDLKVLHQLYLLDDGMVRSWCRQLTRADADWPGWAGDGPASYGEGPLAQMRCRLNLCEDWGKIAPALMEFFAREGGGVTLSARILSFDGAELRAYPFPIAPPDAADGGLSSAPDDKPLLLTGDAAMCKRHLAARDMPGRAVVMLSPAVADCLPLWAMLAALPRRFDVCFDASEGPPAPVLSPLPGNVRLVAVLPSPEKKQTPAWASAFERYDFGV